VSDEGEVEEVEVRFVLGVVVVFRIGSERAWMESWLGVLRTSRACWISAVAMMVVPID